MARVADHRKQARTSRPRPPMCVITCVCVTCSVVSRADPDPWLHHGRFVLVDSALSRNQCMRVGARACFPARVMRLH